MISVQEKDEKQDAENNVDTVIAKQSSPEDAKAKDVYLPSPHDARVKTVRSVATSATARREGRENMDELSLDEFSWFLDEALVELAKAIESSAQMGAASIFCKINVKNFFLPTLGDTIKRSTMFVDYVFGRNLQTQDRIYTFSSEVEMYMFFYRFVDWIRSKILETGYIMQAGSSTYDELPELEGWNQDMTDFYCEVTWGDDDFRRELSYVEDPAQADAYERGVPLEALKLANAFPNSREKK